MVCRSETGAACVYDKGLASNIGRDCLAVRDHVTGGIEAAHVEDKTACLLDPGLLQLARPLSGVNIFPGVPAVEYTEIPGLDLRICAASLSRLRRSCLLTSERQ